MDENYLKDYQTLHLDQSKNYGNSSQFLEYFKQIFKIFKIKDAIDFGCGKGATADALEHMGICSCHKYDPSIHSYSQPPKRKFQALICTDVLEHVPEKNLDKTLRNMRELSDMAFIIPHLGKSSTYLPDGSNAHCTLKTTTEWEGELRKYWPFVTRLYLHSPLHAFYLCSKDNRLHMPALQVSVIIANSEFPKAIAKSLFKRLDTSNENSFQLIDKGAGHPE